MLDKEALMSCIDYAYDRAKKAIVMWNDYRFQQIRLESANLRRIEESRKRHIEEMDERKTLRYKAQADANYERWKNSPNYDPKKDVRLQNANRDKR
jgi:hypothetical protein